MSKPNSPQEKPVNKHACGLLYNCEIIKIGKIACPWFVMHNCEIIKMPSKCYQSAQMTRHFKQAPFVETMLKERRHKVITLC